MTGRAGRLRRLLAASLAAGVFLITSSAGAAQSGVIVTVQDNYRADYGVTIPFTRSPRTTDYTFSLYEGGSAAGAPVVSAKVEMTAAQEDVYLPLAYDITGPQSYTLKIEARPLPGRIGTDTAAAREFSFTTKPTCGCASGTAGAFYRGSGSAADPFYVGSQQQLAHVGAHSAANIYQDRDIALSGNWTPIGSQSAPFMGTYNGGGHRITGLNISGDNHGGLFGYINQATIQRLGIETTGVISGTEAVGSFSGVANNSNLISCYAVAQVRSTATSGWPVLGGLIGSNTACLIEDSYFAGSLQCTDGSVNVRWSGGLCGIARELSTVRRTWNIVEYSIGSASLGPNRRMVGGVAGDVSSGSGSECRPGQLGASNNYWSASGSGGPTYAVANSANDMNYDSGVNTGCTQISSFSSLPADFDPSVWEMGTVTVPTLSGGSKTVSAPVLKVFQP